MDYTHSILIVVVAAVVTMALRFLPFLIFSGKKKTPKIITYLGKVLPYSIMGMLVVYCYKNMAITVKPYGMPEIIAGAVVVLLHLWRRNTLLSIICGTVAYMLLIQVVF